MKSSVSSQDVDDDGAPSVIKDNERKNNQNNKSAIVGGCSGFSYLQDLARILGVKPSN